MADEKRRRLMQAGASLPLLGLTGRAAHSQDRNLSVTARKPGAAPVASAASLVLAPKRALIIGNSSYGFAPLKNPANDARAIGEELTRAGFQVTVGLDLTRAQMLDAIRAYGESLNRSKAVGMFYFAGHGVQLAWRNYLVPTDAKIGKVEDIQSGCVDVNAVIAGIAKAANPMNVVILDACRENPFGEVKLDQKGLSQLDAPPGTLLAYATAPGNLASDGDGANGLYTEHLLKEMKVPEAKIEDVFKRVRLGVRRRSQGQQVPWESTSLEEDFWFIPPKEVQKIAAEEAERQRKVAQAEREWRERIAKAQREEAERLKKEAEAALAKQDAEDRRRREQLERVAREQLERRRKEEESERAFREELALWEKVSTSAEPGPLEDYLRRYPRGRFSELAQVRLDKVLARQGEKKVEIASQVQNPYTQGSAALDTRYTVGDSYTYRTLDPISKVVQDTYTQTITKITDSEVLYDGGRIVSDLLGNPRRLHDGRTFGPNQVLPQEFFVGKKWSTRFLGEHPRFGPFEATFNLRIVSRESITVPAGTFDCFRMEGRGESYTSNGVVGNERTMWLAPGRVRRAVAHTEARIWNGREVFAERTELVAYKQA